MRTSLHLCLVACCLFTSHASGSECNSPSANSPQFKDCLFANPPNPQTPPGASTWAIWSRFIFSRKVDPVFGARVSPFSFVGPKRFHAPPLTLQQLPPIEGLILSHDHYDHLDVPTIEYLAQRVQRYFVPLGVKARLVDMGVLPERVQEFDWWQAGTHAGVQLTATPAQHFSGRTLTDRNRTLWASWVIQSGGQRIYYCCGPKV